MIHVPLSGPLPVQGFLSKEAPPRSLLAKETRTFIVYSLLSIYQDLVVRIVGALYNWGAELHGDILLRQ
jgi:hypothetical protein